jgi:choloylglycine hydrolase
MCTAININSTNTYFGRNLDLDYQFDTKFIFTPRKYIIKFKNEAPIERHYAIYGLGIVKNNYPLYADAINEEGLAIAALNFPYNAVYNDLKNGKINLTTYELMLYLLSVCSNLKEVELRLSFINILDMPFDDSLQTTPLHFLISDKTGSLVLESTSSGLHIYDNPFQILTNNPPFNYQLEYLSHFDDLSPNTKTPNAKETFSKIFFSNGNCARGLPGDYSSSSRLIKANFVKNNLIKSNNEIFNIHSFFSVLDSVNMPCGSILTEKGFEYTRYSDCYNLDRQILYYKTFENPNLHSINLKSLNKEFSHLISFKLPHNFSL